MKISLDQLKGRRIPRLVLRSVTMSICTVEVELEDGSYVLCDRAGGVMRFNGVEHARNALSELDVEQALLHHDSPYHEMVGLSEDGAEPIRVPLDWGSSDN